VIFSLFISVMHVQAQTQATMNAQASAEFERADSERNKVHRPWEHKEFNLSNRAVLSKYFSPELTKLFLKNTQVERDCPEATSAELSSTQFSDLRTSTIIAGLIFASRRERPRLVGSKHLSNC
jgi:hypothetical protein